MCSVQLLSRELVWISCRINIFHVLGTAYKLARKVTLAKDMSELILTTGSLDK